MADSSLSITKTELDIFLADHLGWGRTAANWGTTNQARIDQARDSGLSRFYMEHDWSFLRIVTSLTTTADQAADDLPDAFGSLFVPFAFAANKGYTPPVQRPVAFIEDRISESDSSSTPKYYAINAKAQTGVAGTRYEVLWYPYPDEAFVFTYGYEVQRDALTSSYPYPAGTSEGRQALMWACLAEAEAMWNDGIGIGEQKYADALPKALAKDGRRKTGNLGFSRDGSDGIRIRGRYDDQTPRSLIDGSLPS